MSLWFVSQARRFSVSVPRTLYRQGDFSDCGCAPVIVSVCLCALCLCYRQGDFSACGCEPVIVSVCLCALCLRLCLCDFLCQSPVHCTARVILYMQCSYTSMCYRQTSIKETKMDLLLPFLRHCQVRAFLAPKRNELTRQIPAPPRTLP